MSLLPCPQCGGRLNDLWDYDWGERDVMYIECDHCQKPVDIHRHVSVSYSVTAGKAEPEDVVDVFVCPGCHAVGAEHCLPGCVDAEIRRQQDDDDFLGDFYNEPAADAEGKETENG